MRSDRPPGLRFSRIFGAMVAVVVLFWIGIICAGVYLIKHCNHFTF